MKRPAVTPASVNKPLFRRVSNRCFHLLARFLPGATTLRPMLHRARGVKIGRDVFIGEEVYLDNEYPECIEIHEGAQINIRVTIVAHTRGPGKVIVGKNAFLGANVVVACSEGRTISIGEGAVVGPGAAITKSVPPHLFVTPDPPKPVAWAGVPMTMRGSIESFRAGLRPIKKTEKSNPSGTGSPSAPSKPDDKIEGAG